MRRLASSVAFGALLSLAVCVPGSALAASAGSTPLDDLLASLNGRLTLEAAQPLSSLLADDRIMSPVLEPPQAQRSRPRIRRVPGPGAFLAVGACALLLAASLRRRPR